MQANKSFGQGGFTIIELMVAVIILGLLVAIGVPSFNSTIANNRVISETNRLVSSIQNARSEAIKRNAVIVMERSSGTNAVWNDGWETFVDASATLSGSAWDVDNDTLIRVTDESPGQVSILSDATANAWLSFARNGMLNENSAAIFHICNNNDASTGRRVTVDRAGRPVASDIPGGSTCTP